MPALLLLQPNADTRVVLGDATDSGLLRYVDRMSNGVERTRFAYRQLFEIPFNSANKWAMTVTECPGERSTQQGPCTGRWQHAAIHLQPLGVRACSRILAAHRAQAACRLWHQAQAVAPVCCRCRAQAQALHLVALHWSTYLKILTLHICLAQVLLTSTS